MGIRERQERERQAVRRAILDAARDLFVNDGYQHVSIRKIAERIEYSPAAIYSYFPSKDDIFFELAEEGFRLLCDERAGADRLVPRADGFADDRAAPLDRLRAVFWRFYEFSCQHPQYFLLMFVDRSVPRITREYERFAFAKEMKVRIVEDIQRCIDARVFPPTCKPAVAVRVLMMAMLGAAVMRLTGRLGRGEDPADLARDVLEVALAGLRSDVGLRASDVDCLQEAETQS